MKHKRDSCHSKPWSAWVELEIPSSDLYVGDNEPPAARYANSRYVVSIWYDGGPNHPMGQWAHLSIKDQDNSARHDWRDFQRIKNELCGEQYDALEVYPAESRLVDTCNQFHLYVFLSWHPPFGFKSRLVADASISKGCPGSRQRDFEVRPADCITGAEFDQMMTNAKAHAATLKHGAD